MPRTILLVPVLLFGTLAASASAEPAPEADVAGLYVCDGVSPDGQPYQGLVEIVKYHETYQLVWWLDSEVAGVGIGIRTGNVLAVMHYSGAPGVIAYRIEDGRRLVGQWTVTGADGTLFSETLTPAPQDISAPSPRSDPEPAPRRRRPRPAVVALNGI